MKTPFHFCSRPDRFFGVALSLALSLFACGALMMPAMAMAATTENPVVDQQPLTIQPSIPPDIVLMLDDSGSMNANFMPDWSYLKNNGNPDAVIDASNNGVYYNPTVTYAPPPEPNGALYPPQTNMSSVAVDGFGATTTDTVNLFTYTGVWECDDSSHCGGGTSTADNKIQFNTLVKSTSITYSESAPSAAACQAVYDSMANAFGDITFDDSNSTDGSGNCSFQYYPAYFQYSTGDAVGPYTVYYVAPASQGCGSQPNCVLDSAVGDGTNGAPAGVTVGENIANWFAYYHTRLLMAKSGLMTAFSNLDTDFRVGFGSINGKNAALISKLPNSFKFSTTTQPDNYLAGVAPFGKPTDPSDTAGIQRFNFWAWIASEKADGVTPLRQALDAVGQYYSDNDATTPTSNAWDSMSSDPGFVAGDTTKIACRQAYTILTTDGFWNETYPQTGQTGVGNADNTPGSAVTGPDNQSYTYSPAAPYSDTYSDTLADVAMHYWETDLQGDLDNEVPTGTDDPAFWQHMVTFTLGLGFTPEYQDGSQIPMDAVQTWADGGAAITDWPGWPQPSSSNNGSINNIADLAHAGVNGHGGFYSATTPQAFVRGIEAALNRATARLGTGASLAANSTQLTTGSVIYQSTYYTSTWKGDLKAFSINSVNGAIATTPTWQASQKMPTAASRDIQTYNLSTGAFVDFKNGTGTPPSLSTDQLNALGSDATAQEDMVNYLRGDTSGEQQNGGSYRNRDWVLGDIVDSQPVYSGVPDPNEFQNQSFYGTLYDSTTSTSPFESWAVGTTDSSGTFTASAASVRTPLIFVAANDGMLHAFDASTGAEVYAYLPGAVITNGLKNLADPSYGSAADPHQFYNDGQLTIADAYIDTGDGSGQSWHTILVGTTGRGPAEAVYALDITNPADIKPLWERSAGDGKTGSDYIGQMTGKPVIAQTNYTPASGKTAASSTWSVLMGNGYNSTEGVAALLQFNLATGALTVHTTTDTTTGNGLAAPVAWMDNASDGVSDMAYAGDLHGHVWAFQLNDTTGSSGSTYTASAGSLLFTAEDADGNPQPITAGMLAGQDPSTSNIWLFFGTGEYLNSADLTSTATQTWYGLIVDKCTTSTSKKGDTSTSCTANVPGSRSNLTQRTITAETTGGSGTLPARSVSSEVIDSDGTTDMDNADGWYLDLKGPNATATDPAERMVDPNEFQGTLLVGVTRIPKVSDICNPSGSGWIMAVNPFTGAAPSGDFFDVNNDGYVNAGDRVGGSVAAGVGFGSLPNAPIFVGGIMETSFDNGSMSSITTAGSVGTIKRVSWRELVN